MIQNLDEGTARRILASLPEVFYQLFLQRFRSEVYNGEGDFSGTQHIVTSRIVSWYMFRFKDLVKLESLLNEIIPGIETEGDIRSSIEHYASMLRVASIEHTLALADNQEIQPYLPRPNFPILLPRQIAEIIVYRGIQVSNLITKGQ